MNAEHRLLPCPFCGGSARLAIFGGGGMAGSQTHEVAAFCAGCGARGPHFTDGAYQPEGVPAKAAAKWNERAA